MAGQIKRILPGEKILISKNVIHQCYSAKFWEEPMVTLK